MFSDIPQYGLRSYALLFSRHGTGEEFGQSELDWAVGESMRKKTFAVLLRAGWIRKASRNTYVCSAPDAIMRGLAEFKVPDIIKASERPYAFTGLSAVEIWSDYSYVQRGMDNSPYFIKVLPKDVTYWKAFFRRRGVPVYVGSGSTVGEYVILVPEKKLHCTKKEGLNVEGLKDAVKIARSNDIYSYAYEYIKDRYGPTSA